MHEFRTYAEQRFNTGPQLRDCGPRIFHRAIISFNSRPAVGKTAKTRESGLGPRALADPLQRDEAEHALRDRGGAHHRGHGRPGTPRIIAVDEHARVLRLVAALVGSEPSPNRIDVLIRAGDEHPTGLHVMLLGVPL